VEHHHEAASKVEEIRPLRRNINHARKLLEAHDFVSVIELLNPVIDVSNSIFFHYLLLVNGVMIIKFPLFLC